MHFFLAIHVFFLQCMFLKVLAPIRPRYGPDTAPIRPRHGPDTSPIRPPKCIFPKIQPPKAGIFWKNRNYKELIGAIRGEEFWIELSWLFCFCELYVMEKWVDLCENEKVRNQTSWRYFFWRHAFGKKAAWKQRRWFWCRSSNVSICVCCMSFKQSKAPCCSFLRLCFWWICKEKACKKSTCEFLQTRLRNSQCELLQAWLRTCFKNRTHHIQRYFCTTHEKARPLRGLS